MSQSSDPSPIDAQSSPGKSFLSSTQLQRALIQYVQETADLIARAFEPTEERDSEVRLRLVFETLANTRLRAKLSLEALDRCADDTEHGARLLQASGLTTPIAEFEEKALKNQLAKEDIWHQISAFDKRIQEAIDQLHESEPDMEECLGQVLSIFSMMRRACSYVVSSESQSA